MRKGRCREELNAKELLKIFKYRNEYGIQKRVIKFFKEIFGEEAEIEVRGRKKKLIKILEEPTLRELREWVEDRVERYGHSRIIEERIALECYRIYDSQPEILEDLFAYNWIEPDIFLPTSFVIGILTFLWEKKLGRQRWIDIPEVKIINKVFGFKQHRAYVIAYLKRYQEETPTLFDAVKIAYHEYLRWLALYLWRGELVKEAMEEAVSEFESMEKKDRLKLLTIQGSRDFFNKYKEKYESVRRIYEIFTNREVNLKSDPIKLRSLKLKNLRNSKRF